jgi:hypothetical protein
MQSIIGLLFAATLLTGIALGTRLLWSYRRTHGIPELVFGIGVLCTCASGIVRAVLLNLGDDASPGLVDAVTTLFTVLFVAAPIGMVLGTWKVFRPDDRWATGLALGITAVLVASVPTLWFMPEAEAGRSMVILSAAIVVSAWTTLEALMHYAKMRRRMRLGLADAVTATQFLTWGLAMGCNTVSRGVTLGIKTFAGLEPMQTSAFLLPAALLGFVTLSFLYVAFFPPLALQDWLNARGTEAGT